MLKIEIREVPPFGESFRQDSLAELVGDAELPLEIPGSLGTGKRQPLLLQEGSRLQCGSRPEGGPEKVTSCEVFHR